MRMVFVWRIVWRVALAAAVVAIAAAVGGRAPARGASGPPLKINGETIASASLYDAAKAEGVVNAYFSYPQAIMQRIVQQFAADTGIKVNLTSMPSDQLAERIKTEAGAGKLQADVISLTERAAVQDLIDQKLLAPYLVPRFKLIPAALKDPKGYWYAEARPVYGFAYNKALIAKKDVPRTWKDLLRPDLKGRIGILNAYTGGSGWTCAMFERQKFGLSYWKKLAAQQPFLANGVGQLTDALVRGQIAVAVDHFGTVAQQVLKGAPLSFVFPREGSPSVMEELGMARTAPHPAAAKLYLNWALSQRGASVIAKETGEYTAFSTARGPYAPRIGRVSLWVPSLSDYLRLRQGWITTWAKIFNYTPS